ncbi:divalent metal cation transporter [bacterium]|nr:divalent metal cation transporter [bacterium]
MRAAVRKSRTIGCSAEGLPPKPAAPGGPRGPLRRILDSLGPGFVTGASDDDPSGIGTYSVAGATMGFAVLWMALVTFPLMAGVQYICAKISMVSGVGLAGVLRERYPRGLLYPCVLILLIANTLNAGADIAAIAAALNLLFPLPISGLIIPIAALILSVQIFGAYRLVASIFKWLSLTLFAYIGAALFAKPDLWEVLRGTFVPTLAFDGKSLITYTAILGTTISPYLFFWQGSMEVEDEISRGLLTREQRQGATDTELRDAAIDVNIGMFFSNLVMYFIILATATTLFKTGQTGISSATDAAQALKPLAGEAAALLFALGILGTGFLAVPILTCSASYAVAEALGWRHGLRHKLWRARGFYALIICSTLVGVLIDFTGINPIDALVWSAVLNGFIAPPLLAVIMLVANNRAVLGDRVNGRLTNVLGWGATLLMTASAIGLLVTWGQ